jgi:hypothetical protein
MPTLKGAETAAAASKARGSSKHQYVKPKSPSCEGALSSVQHISSSEIDHSEPMADSYDLV